MSDPGSQPGDRISLQIESVAFGGDGIGRTDGLVVFVPFSVPGDHLNVELIERQPRLARGRIVDIVTPAATREVPPCPYYQSCGGCQYQHLAYTEELRLKTEQVRDAFARIGKITDIPLRPIIPSPEPYHYRNRMTVHAENGRIGFRGVDPRELIDVEQCALALPEVNNALRDLRDLHPRDGHYSLRLPGIPPSGFYQSNHLLLETLRRLVVEIFSPEMTACVEAYCGGGFFTAGLIERFASVIAIEKDPRTLKDVRRLPQPPLRVIEGEVENELEPALRASELAHTALLIDPPREGLPKSVLRAIPAVAPAEIIYVSCHPPTLARDAQALAQHYKLVSVQPIDLFPRTAQIECVTYWKRK
jgi:23S rRNA (uracil1939-C5)-methyltransferase